MRLEHRTTGTSSRHLLNEYNKIRKYIPVHPPEESSHECNPWDSMSSKWGNLCVASSGAEKVYKRYNNNLKNIYYRLINT